jgi:SAM-dependent methyltransferase
VILPDFNISSNIYVPVDVQPDNIFEKNYVAARTLERRMYTDEEAARLPSIQPDHPHYLEWKFRKRSCQKLLRYLESKKNILSILEVGCGNGWLSHELSRIPGSKIIGLDINLTELQQAARVFNQGSKLKFVYGNILSGILNDLTFDVIVFAASIQYFHSLPELLNVSLGQLYRGGEIHILDSPFYKKEEITAAMQRSRAYYARLGFPVLADYYFHHSIGEMQPFNHKLLFDPSSIKNKLFGHKHPFPWICIKKD